MEKINKFLDYGKKAINIYESQLTKDIINAIPASDNTARKQYKGEKHSLLILKNNRLGVANYLGPGTNIIKRLEDNDPPRTYVDKVAKLHDINYSLSTYEPDKLKQLKDIRDADALMINQLKNKNLDNKINIAIGEKFIKSKIALEDIGVLNKDQFAGKLNMYSKKDKELFLIQKKRLLDSQPSPNNH
jgi:hypothetical protein